MDCDGNAWYYLQRGFARRAFNADHEGAIADYYRAIELSRVGEFYFRRAESRHALGLYDQAISDYDTGISLISASSAAEYYFRRARTRYSLGNYSDSINDDSQAIFLSNTNAEYYFRRGETKVIISEYLDAIADYTEAINLNSNKAEYYFRRGIAKSLLTNYQDAIVDYSSAISHTSSPSYSYYFKRAQAKQLLADYNNAIIDYNSAISVNSNDPRALFNKGLAQHFLSNNIAAIDSFSQALNLNSTNADEVYFHSAVSNYILGNNTNILIALNQAIIHNATNPAFYFFRGLLKHELVDYDSAIADYYRAIELNNMTAAFYYYRGASYYAIHNTTQAAADYTHAKLLNETDPAFYSYPNVAENVFSKKTQLIGNYEVSQTTNLIAHYSFDDGSAIDVTGNGHNGTLVNGVATSVDINGASNQAVAFNSAANTYIKGDATYFPVNERTISLWFYLTSSSSDHPTVFAYGGNPCGFGFAMSINSANNAGHYEVQSGCGQNRLSAAYTTFPDHTWHHWAVTSNDLGTKMYVDLELIASNDNPITGTNTIGREFAIGANVDPNMGHAPYTDSNTDYFSGIVDELKIYNKALSHQEIIELFLTYNTLAINKLNNGLIAYYPFNGNVSDVSGKENHGTAVGNIYYSSISNNNLALSLNGTGYVKVEDNIDFHNVSGISFSFLFNLDEDNNAESFFVSKAFGGYNVFINFENPYQITSIPESSSTDNSFLRTLPNICQPNQWYHLAVSYARPNIARLYLNGINVLNSIHFLNGGIFSSNVIEEISTGPLRIGEREPTLHSAPFKGKIDELRVYNRALLVEEIQLLYSIEFNKIEFTETNAYTSTTTATPSITSSTTSTTTATPTSSPIPTISAAFLSDGLVAYYPFTDGSVNDFSGNNHHGTIVNSVTTTTEGRYGDGMVFNDGYIQIPDHADLQIGYLDYTLSAWIKTSDVSHNGRIFQKAAVVALQGQFQTDRTRPERARARSSPSSSSSSSGGSSIKRQSVAPGHNRRVRLRRGREVLLFGTGRGTGRRGRAGPVRAGVLQNHFTTNYPNTFDGAATSNGFVVEWDDTSVRLQYDLALTFLADGTQPTSAARGKRRKRSIRPIT